MRDNRWISMKGAVKVSVDYDTSLISMFDLFNLRLAIVYLQVYLIVQFATDLVYVYACTYATFTHTLNLKTQLATDSTRH